ncbi:SRPBCC family protein [Levilactobacillus tangyuanensis]|uniref:SRPBCC family protein n=1 Tax=Levilactobacillus tangyuanensis TaxID=2486021 RepID=A0ABW1TP75_9LACO|nr:SRPBCC family protein [Levilactobacillus tangyuanensis]
MNKLFTNQVLINADRASVHAILADAQQLLTWNPAISSVAGNANQFRIDRTTAALNQHELLTITTTPDQIVYDSTEGRLAYQLRFRLTSTAEHTLVEEELWTADGSHLPLKLLAPIAKQAFAANLNHLRRLVEHRVVD